MRGKKGAMEMSMGTIVTLVLALSMMMVGLVIVKNIGGGATGAINDINKEVINEINDLFTDKDSRLAVAPNTRKLEIEQGEQDEGFAFSIRNLENGEKSFSYTISVDPNFAIDGKCGISAGEANNWVLIPSGSVSLRAGAKSELPELVIISVPASAPLCTIPFLLSVKESGATYVETKILLTIVPK